MQSSERLGLTLASLADPTRRAILARLATGEASVQELAEPFDMSQPEISKHLKVWSGQGSSRWTSTRSGVRADWNRKDWKKPWIGSSVTARSSSKTTSASMRYSKSCTQNPPSAKAQKNSARSSARLSLNRPQRGTHINEAQGGDNA